MMVTCSSCGAPLEAASTQDAVSCRYCGAQGFPTEHAIGRRERRALPWVIGALLLVLALAGAGGLWLFFASEPVPVHDAKPLPRKAARPAKPPLERAPASRGAARSSDSQPAIAEKPAPVARAKPAPRPIKVGADGYVSRDDAKYLLEPEVMKCLVSSNVHYLVTRLGQGYDAKATGPLGPLVTVDVSHVDYRPVSPAEFSASALGQCVLAAAREVKTRAVKGAYLHFALRNERIPDPLKDAPARLDMKATAQALAERDPEGRECAVRHPDDAPAGTTVSIGIEFLGRYGTVLGVNVLYLPPDSPYVTCLHEVYRATVTRPFRSLQQRVMHRLEP